MSAKPSVGPDPAATPAAPRSLLRPLAVVLLIAAIVAIAQLVAVAIEARLSGVMLAELVRGRGNLDGQALVGLMRATALSQLTVIGLVGVVAAAARGDIRRSLRLVWPQDGARAFVLPLAVMLGLLALTNAVSVYVLRHDVLVDLDLYRRALASPARGWAIAAIAFGAPLSEELLFRGLLLPALAATRLGFPVAALLSTLAWAALHVGYTWVGLTEVVLAGFALSWAWRRSGSLWVPIVCHAAYNGAVLLALLAWTV